MSGIAEYLRIPSAYCQSLGRLRWSADGDAVESMGWKQPLLPRCVGV